MQYIDIIDQNIVPFQFVFIFRHWENITSYVLFTEYLSMYLFVYYIFILFTGYLHTINYYFYDPRVVLV